MTTTQICTQRLTVTSSRPFEDVVATFEAAIGHPDRNELFSAINAAETYSRMEGAIKAALGKSGFMEFARFDLGAVLRKEGKDGTSKIVRFLIGNPLYMKELVRWMPDAGSYAPVTVLIDERPDGVHLTYDLMAGFLASYGNADALKHAQALDLKVGELLREAAEG